MTAPISICLTTFRAERAGAWTEELTAHEVRLLNVLLCSRNFEREREEIVNTLWGKKSGAKVLVVLASRLRKKLAPLGVTIPHLESETSASRPASTPPCTSYKLVFR